ncbi:MAG TPA: helix-turn-helix transcriptional regulator [Longimicrobium sp.]
MLVTRLAYLRELRDRGRRNLDFLMEAQADEKIRQALLRELRTHHGQRSLASLIGVGRSVIRKFVEMRSVPTAENMGKIADWIEDRPAVPAVPLGCVCFAALVADLDADHRYAARRDLARVLATRYLSASQEVPKWLQNEITFH